MEASSSVKPWRVEHMDLHVSEPYVYNGQSCESMSGGRRWVTWETQYDFEKAIAKLKKMYCKHMSSRIYTYRIRNLETGEIIPGEIFDG